MIDIVERLRSRSDFWSTDGFRWYRGSKPDSDCTEAADEIKHLRAENAALVAALDKIAERTGSDDPCAQLVHMARKALRERGVTA